MLKHVQLKDVFLFLLGVAIVAAIVIWAANSSFANPNMPNHSAPAVSHTVQVG
jgi:hypothetical protein